MVKFNFKQTFIDSLITIILVSIIFFVFLSIDFGYPNIKLNYGVLSTEKLSNGHKLDFGGLYHPIKNTITINVNNSKDEILSIFFHEYGHYIYNKHLNNEEKSEWKKNFCKKKEREGYNNFQLCEEEFADGFANYLLHRMNTIEEWNYFEEIIAKYLT